MIFQRVEMIQRLTKGVIHPLQVEQVFNLGQNLFQYFTYKTSWYRRTIQQVGKQFPSSQLCSCFGYRNREVLSL
ncbi:hypothetical protein [Shimazuella alba]|uniref:Transposase n=1 Tax=Shimazuella alba TaxID=2690964 RepID=A0A6I4VLZ9_9BACL|nr:hypothetical protein [Shimazuella alba]MXQ52649.1 hypothetical protein [Shimazuella alba]